MLLFGTDKLCVFETPRTPNTIVMQSVVSSTSIVDVFFQHDIKLFVNFMDTDIIYINDNY